MRPRMLILAVVSGKGGAGKTMTSCALARHFSRRSPVTVLDLDLHGPNVLTQFGFPLRYAEMTAGKVKPVWYEPNLAVYSAEMQGDTEGRGFVATDAQKREWVLDAFEAIDLGPSRYVVCDLPAGLDEIFYQVAQHAPIDAFVVVTNPDEPALQDAEKMVRLMIDFKLHRKILGVVENKARIDCPKCQHSWRVANGVGAKARLCEQYGLPFLGEIPYIWKHEHADVLEHPMLRGMAEALVRAKFKQRKLRRLLGGG